MSVSCSSREIRRQDSTPSYQLLPPVTTSLPLLNSSRVQLGFARRIVIAANFFRSYEDPGTTSLIPRRSMGIRLLSICAVDTMLWIMGVGVSSPSSPPPASVLLRSDSACAREASLGVSAV